MVSSRIRFRRTTAGQAASCAVLALALVFTLPTTASAAPPEESSGAVGREHGAGQQADGQPQDHPGPADGQGRSEDRHGTGTGGDGGTDDGQASASSADGDEGENEGEGGERAQGQGSDADDRETERTDTDEPADLCVPMVTHSPEGSTGDRHAVAITSQALETGRAGWEHASWEAADGTTIEEVHVVREDEVERLVDGDLQTGHAENLLELRFCGETDPTQRDRDEDPDGEPHPPEEEQQPPPDGAGSGDPDDVDTGDETPADGDGTDEETETGAEGEVEVEVLGVQITAEDDGDVGGDVEVLGTTLARTGASLPLLVAIGAAGLLLGFLGLASGRKLERRYS